MTKHDNTRPQAEAADTLTVQRERAARLRDAAGRFRRRDQDRQVDEQRATSEAGDRTVRLPVPTRCHPEVYALVVGADGLGLHAPPGSYMIVEPTTPNEPGLAVFYFKGRNDRIVLDLTHNFSTKLLGPFHPESEVVPLIEVVDPISGRLGSIRADRIEKIHRTIGVQVSIDIKHGRAPPKLPLLTECPEGMGKHPVRKDTSAYPLVRPGETIVYDPSQREPTDGALCILEWSNGVRSVLLTNFRQSGGKGESRWWVDPVNRPGNAEMLERRLARNTPGDMMHTSDGPFTAEHLRKKIVGTVVGVLVPWS